jgi:hypothetical protein
MDLTVEGAGRIIRAMNFCSHIAMPVLRRVHWSMQPAAVCNVKM